ncbi:MAG: hypothetical protein HYV29_11400 [Ignavibacteriales bacterium]|nr:hypothetical protein [Ignavibacteriales bacterium]
MSRQERVKRSVDNRNNCDGREYVPGHFFFILCILAVLSSCSSGNSVTELCKEKLSAPLQSMISDTIEDSVRIAVTVILSDSTDIVRSFPMLSVPNSKVALGHLTKDEISSLCRHKNVQYIDIPKIRFPNK